MAWTPEPTFAKPDISVRATTLYYRIAAPLMLRFARRRILNLRPGGKSGALGMGARRPVASEARLKIGGDGGIRTSTFCRV